MQFTLKDHLSSVAIATQQTFSIALTEVAGSGYRWTLETIDNHYLEILSATVSTDAISGLVGGSEHAEFQFKAVQPGHTLVRLRYWRPWQDESDILERFELHIHIQTRLENS